MKRVSTGDDFGQLGFWNKLGTLSGNAPEIRIRCGPQDILTPPAWPPCPPSADDCSGCAHAWVYVSANFIHETSIVKWDVPGGLKYRTTTLGVPNP